MSHRRIKTAGLLKELAATFFQKVSCGPALITVTGCILSDDLQEAKILVSVLPDSQEEQALDFLKRKRADFRDYVKKNAKLMSLPFFDVEIDRGEKNRQRIDEIFIHPI